MSRSIRNNADYPIIHRNKSGLRKRLGNRMKLCKHEACCLIVVRKKSNGTTLVKRLSRAIPPR